MSSEGSEPVGSPVKVAKVCFAYVVKPFTGEVVKVCSGPNALHQLHNALLMHFCSNIALLMLISK